MQEASYREWLPGVGIDRRPGELQRRRLARVLQPRCPFTRDAAPHSQIEQRIALQSRESSAAGKSRRFIPENHLQALP
jgi:hypothetical protein